MQIKLHTGRTHQIRVHFSTLNHPLIGDVSYGGNTLPQQVYIGKELKSQAHLCLQSMQHQALHARMLGFTHPITNEHLLFKKNPPKDFIDTAKYAGILIPIDLTSENL